MPNGEKRKHYADRGIKVCEQWSNSFETFYSDMGDCPTGFTLERIDNDKGYEPGNCKWATRQEQSNNRTTNVNIELNGEVLNLTQWGIKTGLGEAAIRARLHDGFTVAQSLDSSLRGWDLRKRKLRYK